MIILIPILLLFLIPVAILALNQTQVRIGYNWFLALGAAFLAWLLFLIARAQLPLTIELINWEADGLVSVPFMLLLDETSWVYAVVVTALPLAVLLTDVVQSSENDSRAWASSLVITGLGLLAILAENPLTLLFAWATMDLSEMLILLRRVSDSESRERVIVAFSVRVAGILLVLSAAMRARFQGVYLSFESFPPSIGWYLLLAAGLRLGVLPPHQAFFQEPPLRRGLGTIVRLVPVASSLVLLARVASVGVPQKWEPYLLVIAVIAVLYSSIAWARAENELDGRPHWILGLATLSLVAAVRGLPEACIAWGLALIVSGATLFLMSLHARQSLVLGIAGLMSVSMLPFTPHWQAVAIYQSLNSVFVVIFILAHAFLLFGYLRYVFRKLLKVDDAAPWMLIIYPLGLALLPLTHWLAAFLGGGISLPYTSIYALPWWGGILALGLTAVLILISRKKGIILPRAITVIRRGLSLQWLYRFLWRFYRTMSRLFSAISQILEGEGGVLWALLLLLLLISVMRQWGGERQP
ncbi:MAG: hypothetical protein U9Q82_04110 [Chloroflexota bacterium]|nr:hypothetical protein [Chloroflexota bacterium]